jgi:hypothetical protein
MAPRNRALTLDPRCRLLPGGRVGPFAALSGGRLLTVEADAVLESADLGGTWSARRRVCRCGPRGRPSGEGVLLRTRRGTLVYVYMDMATYRWSWDTRRREAGPEVRLDVWSVRSRDQGLTWTDRQQVYAGYCGALIDIVQTRGGAIVVPIQRLVREPSRHAIATYVSTDEGLSWEPSKGRSISKSPGQGELAVPGSARLGCGWAAWGPGRGWGPGWDRWGGTRGPRMARWGGARGWCRHEQAWLARPGCRVAPGGGSSSRSRVPAAGAAEAERWGVVRLAGRRR